MPKRIYRAVPVKSVKIEQLADRTREQDLVIGVDVAKARQYAAVMTREREVLQIVRWNQLEGQGNEPFVRLLRALAARSLAVALEPSGSYGDPLRYELEDAGIPVFGVSPKRCHDYTEVLDGVPSQHDGKSAVALARLHWEGLSRRWAARSAAKRELAAGVRVLNMHHDHYRRSLGRLEGLMARHWPELSTILDLDRATTLALLIEWGDPRKIAASAPEARERMKSVGGHWLTATKIDAVLRSARTTRGVPMHPAECALIQAVAAEARRSRTLYQKATRALKELIGEDASVEALSSAMGPTTAIVTVIKGGDPRQHPSAASYVKSLGLNLKERSSGTRQGQLRLSKRGSGVARKWLYLWTLRMVKNDPVVRAWYWKKVSRDGGKKMKALSAVMRKLASALWHVARGSSFDSRKLFDVRRLHVVPRATS